MPSGSWPVLPDWAELELLRTAVGRPYAVELSPGGVSGSGGSGVEPASVIMAYADLRPIVLWGSWLDSEVIIGIDPMITHRLTLDEINKGFDLMHAGESIRSVVIY